MYMSMINQGGADEKKNSQQISDWDYVDAVFLSQTFD